MGLPESYLPKLSIAKVLLPIEMIVVLVAKRVGFKCLVCNVWFAMFALQCLVSSVWDCDIRHCCLLVMWFFCRSISARSMVIYQNSLHSPRNLFMPLQWFKFKGLFTWRRASPVARAGSYSRDLTEQFLTLFIRLAFTWINSQPG